jgi:voltage-gated potassium channel
VLTALLALYGLAVFGYITATFASFFIGRDAEEPSTGVAGSAELSALREEIAALRLGLEQHGLRGPEPG